jgi:hypothetical protein
LLIYMRPEGDGITNRLGEMELRNFKLNLATIGHSWETPKIA